MKTILLVDDEDSMVEVLSGLLEDEGYHVVAASDGEEALTRIAGPELPDLVLLDVMMPKVDGREVLRRMHADPQLRSIPVILMSATAHPISQAELGEAVFLQKPFDLHVLLQTLTALLTRQPRRED